MEEEKLKAFNDFDWSDERWQTYLSGLYPQPNYKQVAKFKRKWYKKNIDAEFDDTYEPATSSGTSSAATSSTPSTGTSTSSGTYTPAFAGGADGSKWATLGFRATLCFLMYAGGVGIAVASVFGAADPNRPLMMLTGAFVFDLVVRIGIKFSKEHLQTLFLEDVGMMPFFSMAMFMPGTHRIVHVVALMPVTLTALLSLAQISKHHKVPGLPGFISSKLDMMADISVRYQLMQARADGEVMVGFLVVIGVFTKLTSPMAPLLIWNFLMMRYTMSPWTQATFRKIDGVLSPVLGNIPLVKNLYAKMKDLMYSFTDPTQRRSGCSIL